MRQFPIKLLFFVSEDWFFCSHFLDRAVAAREEGYQVLVLTRSNTALKKIREAGLRAIEFNVQRRSLNPFSALVSLARIVAVYRKERPDIVHHVALKPILLGSLAARLTGVRQVVNAVVGMGFVFSSNRLLARMLRPALGVVLRFLLNSCRSSVIFENQDDRLDFIARGWAKENAAVLIRGAGVDASLFRCLAPMHRPPVVMLVARMLWDKGVGEFVEAARILRGCGARFVLVGDTDNDNRAAIPHQVLQTWNAEGVIEWWGFRDDMQTVLAQATIACLPSYREGLPKSLLEAMAAGLPCVTTDVPGCREAVRHNDNGILVPPRDPVALADALQQLLNDAPLRKRMGARGRERVEQEFSKIHVIERTLAVYRRMLSQ